MSNLIEGDKMKKIYFPMVNGMFGTSEIEESETLPDGATLISPPENLWDKKVYFDFEKSKWYGISEANQQKFNAQILLNIATIVAKGGS
jgi:hypothetical protein